MSGVTQEVFPLIWSDDVERLLNWSVSGLGLKEAWRAPGEQGLEHAEVLWPGSRVSINIRTEDSRVAYSFTAVDPDGNQWWVNAETGFLDELRGEKDR